MASDLHMTARKAPTRSPRRPARKAAAKKARTSEGDVPPTIATPDEPATGETMPSDGTAFGVLGLPQPIVDALIAAGYRTPTPIQVQAIPVALRGRDVMGLAQTGTGKTAAFTLPIIARLSGGPRRLRALILTPTRELCQQVEESFRKYGRFSEIDVAPIYGGVPYEPQERALADGVDVL